MLSDIMVCVCVSILLTSDLAVCAFYYSITSNYLKGVTSDMVCVRFIIHLQAIVWRV